MTVDEARLYSQMANVQSDLAPEPAEVCVLPESLGVALSGGGVRAALFSLGVLMGLVESGEHRKVTSVSSVSGGSIVNAAVAQSCELPTATPETFESVAKPIAEGLCRRGTFVFSRSAVWALARAIAPQFVLVGILGALAWAGVKELIDAIFSPGERVPWPWIAVGALCVIALAVYLLRGLLQEGLYASFLANLKDGGRRRLDQFPDSPTTHVIVATDLVSGAPVYFSREFVCCPAFGWGVPGKTRTASAVYASAAFPVMYPVRRFSRRRFSFQDGTSPPPFPRSLKLNDGGVYNNLGTDWFDVVNHQTSSEIWEFGSRTLTRPPVPVTRRIVVNAGAASRGLRRVAPFLAITRTMKVLYDNTVRPRLDTMRDDANHNLLAHVVIDISESPYNIARRLAEIKIDKLPEEQQEPARGCQARALKLEEWLGRRGETYWVEFTRQTSSTKTKLTGAGLEPGARLMLHGYLSTLVVMNILHDAPWPAVVRDEGYFLDLAGRPNPAAPPAAGTGDDDGDAGSPD